MFPECSFMWFGDSGQGDIDVGLEIIANHPDVGFFFPFFFFFFAKEKKKAAVNTVCA